MHLTMNGIPLLTPRSGVGNYIYQLSRSLVHVSTELEIMYFYGLYFSNELKPKPDEPYITLWRMAKKFINSHQAFQIVKDTTFKLGLPSKVDLYHETNYIPVPFQGPTVITVFDLSLHLCPETHPRSRRQHFKQYFYSRLHRATHFITISETIKNEMVEHLNIKSDKISVTYLGVDSHFKKMPTEGTNLVLSQYGLSYGSYILYVGTMEPRKNISTLLKAYAFLPKRTRVGFPLVLAGGKGWLMDKLEEEIKSLDIASTTIKTGYVPREHLPALYSGAAVFVYPSLYEGFGLPPLEAMACGTPVITSDISALQEVVGDAGILIDPHDVKRLKDEIEHVIDDPSHRTLLSNLGLERARQFTWEVTARQTMEVYSRVLANGR